MSHDSSGAMYFTKNETLQYIGTVIDTVCGTAFIVSSLCCGKNSYVLLDQDGGHVYQSHNSCNYIVD